MATVKSTGKMSNRGWHRAGQPTWWIRIGSGPDARFVDCGRERGDRHLDVTVDLPAGTQVAIGCGKGRDAYRETVTVR